MIILKNIHVHLFFINRELCETLELQIDYWLAPKDVTTKTNEPNNKRVDTKFTLKTGFRSLNISRLFLTNEEPFLFPFFTVNYVKEKKQKSLLIDYI